jgi:hypothetical protein
MPTYKISPFVTGLQNYLFTGADIDSGGKINISGAPGSIYAAKLDNSASSSAANYFLIWDGTEPTASAADIVIPIKHTEIVVMWVDKGITCSTAITVSAASTATGAGGTDGVANVAYYIS